MRAPHPAALFLAANLGMTALAALRRLSTRAGAAAADAAERNAAKQQMHATTSPHTRHAVVVAQSDAPSWPSHIERDEGRLGDVVRRLGKVAGLKITAGHAPGLAADQVLVFPDRVSVPIATKADLDRLADALADNKPVAGGRPLEATFCLVCTHGSRDKRCHEHGVPLVDALRKTRAAGDLVVLSTSHVGGHKWAANMLVYGRDNGHDGVWYALLRACDAPAIADALAAGQVLPQFFRGRLGASSDEQFEEAKALGCYDCPIQAVPEW